MFEGGNQVQNAYFYFPHDISIFPAFKNNYYQLEVGNNSKQYLLLKIINETPEVFIHTVKLQNTPRH